MGDGWAAVSTRAPACRRTVTSGKGWAEGVTMCVRDVGALYL